MVQPNILFVFSDQQHWQAMGSVDGSFDTPNLDRLAAEGTSFENAFCTTPQCSPSRSSIMTGLYPSKTGVMGNVGAAGGDPLRIPTIGKALQEAGYRTAYFGKWHLGDEPVGTAGWDEDLGVRTGTFRNDPQVTERALRFLVSVGEDDRDRPFALFLSYRNPHDIYHFNREESPAHENDAVELPETYLRKDLSTVPPVQRQFMTDDQGQVIVHEEAPAWRRYRELYREKVKLYDAEVGRVLDQVEGAGLFQNTLVVATSDHGDMDGQHGLIYKGPFMYDHMVRVPLIIRMPGNERGESAQPETVDFPSVNVDLAPTLADFADAEISRTDGVSLRPLLEGEDDVPERDAVIGQYYSKQRWVNPIRMIRTSRYKYTLYRSGEEELYDLQTDPEEVINRATDEDYREIKKDMRERLERWLKENQDPFRSQQPTTREGQRIASERS